MAQIMATPRKDQLYYYTKVDKFLYENLINKTIWFSKPSSFNDPFDCCPPLIYGSTSTENHMMEFYDELSKVKLEEPKLNLTKEQFIGEWKVDKIGFEKKVNKTLTKLINDNYGILCLSERDENIKMWSHYANKHTGVVLEFDFHNFITNGKDFYWKVNYPTDGKFLNFLDSSIPANDSIFGQLITKANIWSEEQEVRVCVLRSGLHPLNETCFKGIIFGINTPKEEKISLFNIIKMRYPNAKFSQARRDEDEYKIHIDPFDIQLLLNS